MKFSELVSYTKSFNELETDVLVVVTSLSGYGFLQKHLRLLERQTYQRFNLLLILGKPFEDRELLAHFARKKYKFGVIVARENERRGCAGAYFTGQKYALEKGYKYLAMADDDCMPTDRRLIEELYSHRNHDVVSPTMVWVEDGYRKKGFLAAPTSYSLFSTNVLRKYGLHYLPLFHGADDIEYMERIGIEPLQIKNKVEHPYIVGKRLFVMFDRAWLFLLQAIIVIKDVRTTAYNLLFFAFLSCASFAFLPPYGRRLSILSNRILLTYTYGKKANSLLKSGYESWFVKKRLSDFRGYSIIDEPDPSAIDMSSSSKLSGIIGRALSLIGCDVVLQNTYSFISAFILAMFVRRLYVRVGTGSYLFFADNSFAPLHLARAIVFLLSLPLQLLFLAAFIPVKILLQLKTDGYGLD